MKLISQKKLKKIVKALNKKALIIPVKNHNIGGGIDMSNFDCYLIPKSKK